MADEIGGFFVEGDIEDAYERAQLAIEGIARSRVEEVAPPDWNDVIDFFVSLDEESDRALPVLAFAFIDTEIERLLREAVNQKVHGGVSRLFGPLGPMGAASTRINMAHALHWLSDDTVHDLHLLRRIRNRFAHQRIDDGLRDSQTISDLKDHRLLPRIVNALHPPSSRYAQGSRARFARVHDNEDAHRCGLGANRMECIGGAVRSPYIDENWRRSVVSYGSALAVRATGHHRSA